MRAFGLAVVLTCLGIAFQTAVAEEKWPPAPPLKEAASAADAAPLPASITAVPVEKDKWRCRFRFRPEIEARKIVLAGSFNNWDREANPLQGPDASGDWTAVLDLPTGVYQYKFLVNNEQWISDPLNTDQVPDSFGKFNSFVRLGRLARMATSDGKLGDGRVDTIGLAHQPPQPLYIQQTGKDQVSIRYRTLAHDVQKVSVALRGGTSQDMTVICDGPLFCYWGAQVAIPVQENPRSPSVRGIEYTFVLDDGTGPVCDPYTYHYTFTPTTEMQTPEWARHAIWYEIMLDRFRDGDPTNNPEKTRPWTSEWFTPSPWEGQDGQTFYQYFAFDRFYGGDIAGLEAKLPYLKELGVNALYLTPVFKAPSYHKYDVQNYLHIDDGFGVKGDYDEVAASENLLDPSTWKWTKSDQRFIAFLKKAHELGFKVIIDAVFNHVGAQHPAFLDVQKNGKNSRYADWFEVISWEPFAYKGWADFAHMPVFKKNHYGYGSEGVKKHIFAVTKRWMDPNGDGKPDDGVDGWRLDVPNDVPRPFWAEWRKLVKQIKPDALITGEVWQRADQWLDGDHFDAVMNYEFARSVVAWVFDQKQKITASAAASRFGELQLAYPLAATSVLQNLVNSHDTDRLASMAQNPDREYDRQNRVQDNNPGYDNGKPAPEAYAKARLAALLQMTYIGAPLIYYGDEVGMFGADDPSNRKPMLWKDLEPYEKPEENAVLDDQLAFYKRAIALRNAHPALQGGAFQTLLADDAADVWAFLRAGADEQVLVVLNASATARDVQIPLPAGAAASWTIVFGEGGEVPAANNMLAVRVPRIGGVVLQAKGK